jgi:hypothetical protein
MTHELTGKISGAIVLLSGMLYVVQVLRKRSHPNFTSWSIWAVLGFAIWINYKTSGATDNVWPAFFGMINPIVIAIIALLNGTRDKLTLSDKFCLGFGLLSIVIWWFLERRGASAALYVAILADLCAAYPTFRLFQREPWQDRPMMWILFAFGYGLAIFAIPDNDQSITNYILPVYMLTMSGILSWLLVRYRWKERQPFSEWY